MNEKLAEALDHISDYHIVQAANQKKRKKHYVLRAVAAVLAVVLLLNLPPLSLPVFAEALAAPAEYTPAARPDLDDYEEYSDYEADWDAWEHAQQVHSRTAYSANKDLLPFYEVGFREFLGSQEGNAAWSPVNAGIALAMLAETASGTTRQEILDALGAGSIDKLREGIRAMWETVYQENSLETRVMANSLWLDRALDYSQETMDLLGSGYYASAYRGDLGSAGLNRDIQTWVNNQTEGFLNNQTPNIDLTPGTDSVRTVMALVSTICMQARWSEPFSPSYNTQGTFHTPSGDVTTEFMNYGTPMTYAWGEHFGAVALPTQGDSRMWLILPDEGYSVADVLADGEYLATVTQTGTGWEDRQGRYLVNLSLPKFDIESSLDLKDGLRNLGITEVFDLGGGDFSDTFQLDAPIFVDSIRQSTRVAIDEEGLEAASYLELIIGAGAEAPPDEIVDFVLDRPFLFVVEYEGIPLFAGVVNDP